MKLTPEELKQLPKGIYVMNKCDHCGKLLTGFLTYRGINNQKEYCSNACFEAGEHPSPGFHQKLRSESMITKKLENKAAPKAEETKKAAPKAEETKKGKKAEEPKKAAPKPEEPKKAKPEEPKKAASKAEEPKKGKKAEEPKKAAGKGKKTPYRDGSSFAVAFERLMSGKPMTLDQMFDGLSAGDPSRMTSHMIRRGDETKEFKIERLEDGRLQMTKIYGK